MRFLGEISRSSGAAVTLAVRDQPLEQLTWTSEHLEELDDISEDFSISAIPGDLTSCLRGAGYREPDTTVLSTDIAELATEFARIMDVDRVAIRLSIIDTDACRRFHADYVTARLICTYVGPGTQWLDDADAAAWAGGADPDTLTIHQLDSGDVAIFRGRLWAPDAAAIHRSPPIAGTGVQRLVLVIDPAAPVPIAHV